ncbi:MAG: M23 family metallopeptidase, partial [Gammaproteobacteria bacterium]
GMTSRALILAATFAALLLRFDTLIAADLTKIVWPGPVELSQGELIEVSVAGADIAAVKGRIGKERIFFYTNGSSTFSAIIAADVDAKPASSRLRLSARTRSGVEILSEVPVTIKTKSFLREAFNVPPGFDRMTPKNLAEIRREQAAFARVFAAPPTDRLWDAPFIRPVPHEASASSFGRRRIINGAPRAPHSGMDLSAPAGTDVVATNHGKVVLAGNFFFAGGSIVLDHGGSLFTMYFHLSEIRVGEGTTVKKGDVLGLSGASGRVTGAHLHWGARLANARIDPLELLHKISHHWQPALPSETSASEMEK